MALATARPEYGATIKPGPMVTAPPDRETTDKTFASFATDSGLNGPFVADQLSAFLAHERMGVNLLRTLRSRTNNPILRKEYGSRLDETVAAVDVWETLVQDELGGNHQYASPAGRATEAHDSKAVEALALSGSTDPMTLEQAGLQTYLVAANQCVANARLLAAFARESDVGPSREAMQRAAARLEPSAVSHANWATSTLEKTAVKQAKHSVVTKAGNVAEKATGKIRSIVSPD